MCKLKDHMEDTRVQKDKEFFERNNNVSSASCSDGEDHSVEEPCIDENDNYPTGYQEPIDSDHE